MDIWGELSTRNIVVPGGYFIADSLDVFGHKASDSGGHSIDISGHFSDTPLDDGVVTEPIPVPEPGSLLLVMTGLAAYRKSAGIRGLPLTRRAVQ
jgi:hypothetical protein